MRIVYHALYQCGANYQRRRWRDYLRQRQREELLLRAALFLAGVFVGVALGYCL